MIGKWMIVLAVLVQADSQAGPPPPASQPASQPATSTNEAPPPAQVSDFDIAFDLDATGISIDAIGPDSVIITGPDETLDKLQAIIQLMDSEKIRRVPRLYKLKNAKATTIGPILQKTFQGMVRSTRGPARPEDQIDVVAEPRSNSLIVTAARARVDMVRQLIEGLDEMPSIAQNEISTISIKNLPASKAAEKLIELLQKRDVARSVEPNYTITADERTRSLLITAPEKDIVEIKKLIALIDVPPDTEAIVETVIFPLKHAQAESLTTALQSMINTAGQQESLQEQISRLKLHKKNPDGTDGDPIELDLEKPIRMTADTQTNAVIISTHEDNIEPIGAIISMLDDVALADEMFIRIFPLKYADAASLATSLETLFKSGKELAENPGRSPTATEKVPDGPAGKALVYNVTITSELRTNTLIIAGRQEHVALVQALVEDIDVPGIASKFPVKIVTLEYADASTISQVVSDLATQRLELLADLGKTAVERERVFVLPDPRTNSLIVSANDENYEEILTLVTKLDLPPDKLIDQIQILTLKNLNANDLGPKVEQLWDRRVAQRKERGVPLDQPIIVTDQRSNALVIAANRDDFTAIKQLVDRLEQQELAPASSIYLIELENNDASTLSSTIQTLFDQRMQQRLAPGQTEQPSDRVAVLYDAGANTLIVAASKENYDEIASLVAKLDVAFDTEGVMQIFMMKNADAVNTATTIQSLFDAGIYSPAAGLGGQLSAARQQVAIIADPRSNSIIASASKPNFAIIKSLIDRMDSVEAPVLIGDTRIFKLEHADAVKLSNMLDELFRGIDSAQTTQNIRLGVTFIADQATNTLLLAGSRDGLAKATELIAKLDIPSGPTPANFQTYKLEHASGLKLAPTIQELFDSRREAAEQQGTPFLIQADEASNVLIVSGSTEDHAMLKNLLTMLDVSSTLAAQFKIFPLEQAKAPTLQEMLTELFAQQQRRRAGGAGRARGSSSTKRSIVATSIVADERTNSLLVWAAPSEMENIEQVIKKLDKSQPTMTLMVETIRLQQALAEDLATLLTSAGIASGEQTSGSRANQNQARARILQYMDYGDQGETVIRQLLQQDVTVIPEARTNSLMIIAPPDSMEMLKSFIANLDAIEPIVNEIKVFTLQNADAGQMIETLNTLFESTAGQQRSSRGNDQPESQLTLAGATEGGGGRQQLSFTVDARTNSVIAAGTPEYLALVETLILELDSQDISERVNRVLKLKYVTAPDLEPVLTSFLQAKAELYQDIQQDTALEQRLSREVKVIADEASNSLLLNYDPRMESQIMSMIDHLDQPPPQVMVQVLLAEVTLEDTLDMGLEFALQDLLFSETAVVGPNNTIQGNNFDFVAGTDIGAAGAPNSFGGFSFSITGEDFNFLLRALQTDRRLEVLSRPSIMARDNEEASIIIGQQVPFVRNVNVTDSGQTTSSVEYEDVGISLIVTPHINPDGWVNLEVAPQISDITDSSVQISSNLTAPIFTKTEASTVVTVKDGETVVIGGLITSRAEDRETKVPILGDIPGLGLLFRAMSQNHAKRELLIILTPRVVRDEFSARELAIEERDKSDLLPDSVRQDPLMEKLRVEPSEDGLDMETEPNRTEESTEGDDASIRQGRSIYGPRKPRTMEPIRTRSTPTSDELDEQLESEVQKVDR